MHDFFHWKEKSNQLYGNFEIIVVDDGSTDNTEAVIKPYLSNRLFYYKCENKERGASRNFGAQRSMGAYINFFDSDDIAFPNHLEEAAKLIQSKDNPEWFHLGYARKNPETDKIFGKVVFKEGGCLNNFLVNGNPLSCNGVFVKKEIAHQFPFKEERILAGSEDYELWLRLAANFTLHFSNMLTSLIVEHDARSVKKINPDQIINSQEYFLNEVLSDPSVQNFYKNRTSVIRMRAYLYIAVHLAQYRNHKIDGIKYFFKAIFSSPQALAKKSFYATIKNFLLKWDAFPKK